MSPIKVEFVVAAILRKCGLRGNTTRCCLEKIMDLDVVFANDIPAIDASPNVFA